MHETKPHVALLSSPGMGHVTPVLELAKRLVTHHNLTATLFVVSAGSDSSSAEHQLIKTASSTTSKSITTVILPPVDISHIIDLTTVNVVPRIIVTMHASIPNLRSHIISMPVRPVALVVDLFGTGAIAMARELGMLTYSFVTSNAWFLAVTVHSPNLEPDEVESHVFEEEPLKIPGCRSIKYEDTLEAFEVKDAQYYKDYARVGTEISTADGILVNTWRDLEPVSLKALKNIVDVPVFPIGPLTRPVDTGLVSEVLEWLDVQPKESVLYVSFGSGGTLSAEQMAELAWGLELSGQRFIWVVRPPTENDSSGSFFTVGNRLEGAPDYLPDGFLTRTKKLGLVVQNWGPQNEILAHSSVGGFLTHCGWNSTLESIVNGVPMIGWPLYAEQKMNARMLSEELGVSVRLRAEPARGVVVREAIEKVVRNILEDGKEGNEMRSKVKELKRSGEKAVSKSGSSFNSLAGVSRECEMCLQSARLKAFGA